MDRTNAPGHVNHLFVAEDPATNRPPTELVPEDFNAHQEELMAIIEGVGLAPDPANNGQVFEAIKKLLQAKAGNHQRRIITSSGTFATPEDITADTVFKITLVGAGGGGGGQLGVTVPGGGGAGAVASFLISGLAPSTDYPVLIGASGIGGIPTSVGGVGGTTQITIGGTVYSCAGGAGGSLQSGSGFTIAAAQGAVSASILALPSALPIVQQRGLSGFYNSATNYIVSKGGTVPYGDGGDAFQSISASGYGSGGCGGIAGGNGHDGCQGLFMVEWDA